VSETVTDDGRTRLPSGQLLKRAEDAEGAGRYLDAIQLLRDANREAPQADVEYRLVNARRRGFEELLAAASTASVAESPSVARTQSECTGTIPRVEVAELSPETLRGCIATAGCVHVPGLLDADTAMSLREGIGLALDEWAALRRPYAKRTGSPWFDPMEVDDDEERAALGRKWVNNSGGLLTADSPRTMFRLLETLDTAGLHGLAAAFLGERPTLSANKCTIRRVPVDSNSGWHQDGAFLGSGIRALNIWITLTPCGRDAPGIELLPRRLDYIVETGTQGAYFDWAVGPQLVDELERDGIGVLRPEFQEGDALLFDHYLLHRTAIDASMTRPRFAFETWCFAASAYPSGHVPIVW
jgi:hypothetical protein